MGEHVSGIKVGLAVAPTTRTHCLIEEAAFGVPILKGPECFILRDFSLIGNSFAGVVAFGEQERHRRIVKLRR